MKTVALFALVFLLAACGKEEAHDHDHGPTTDVEKMTDQAPDTDAEEMADDAPETGGAEMKTITLSIEGMS
jgi:hypothetical protein